MVSELEKQINRQLLYRRLRWLGIVLSLAIAGLAVALLVGGCLLDSPDAQQQIDGGAVVAGTVANAIVPGSGMIITPLISAIGAGLLGIWTLKRERDNAQGNKALVVATDTIEKILPNVPKALRKPIVEKMIDVQESTGTRKRIQQARGKV